MHDETWDTPAGLGWENERFSLMATCADAVHRARRCRRRGRRARRAPVDRTRGARHGRLLGRTQAAVRRQAQERVRHDDAAARAVPVNQFTPTATRYTRLDARRDGGGAAGRCRVVAAAVGGRGGRRGSASCRPSARPRRRATRSPRRRRPRRTRRRGGGGRGGLSVADTSTLRWLQSQGVAAILLGDVDARRRRHRHEQRRVARSAVRRDSDRARRAGIVRAHRAHGREEGRRSARAEHAEQVLPGEQGVVQHHRRDSRHRSRAEGRGRDDRRALRFVALGHRRDRQRRRLGRDARGDAAPQDAGPEAAPHDSHRPVDRRGAGAARLARLREAALRLSPTAPGSIRRRNRRSSPPTSTSTTAAARSAASTCRASRPSDRSSTRGWSRSRTWG